MSADRVRVKLQLGEGEDARVHEFETDRLFYAGIEASEAGVVVSGMLCDKAGHGDDDDMASNLGKCLGRVLRHEGSDENFDVSPELSKDAAADLLAGKRLVYLAEALTALLEEIAQDQSAMACPQGAVFAKSLMYAAAPLTSAIHVRLSELSGAPALMRFIRVAEFKDAADRCAGAAEAAMRRFKTEGAAVPTGPAEDRGAMH